MTWREEGDSRRTDLSKIEPLRINSRNDIATSLELRDEAYLWRDGVEQVTRFTR